MMEWTHDVRVDKGYVNFNSTTRYSPPNHDLIIELAKQSNITLYFKLVRIDEGPRVIAEKVDNVTAERNIKWRATPEVDYPAVYRFGYVGVDHGNNQIKNAYIYTVYVNKDLNVTVNLDQKEYHTRDNMILKVLNTGNSFVEFSNDYWFEKKDGSSWVKIGTTHSSPTKISGNVSVTGFGGYLDIGEFLIQNCQVYVEEPGDYRLCKNVCTYSLNNTKTVYVEFTVTNSQTDSSQAQTSPKNSPYLPFFFIIILISIIILIYRKCIKITKPY